MFASLDIHQIIVANIHMKYRVRGIIIDKRVYLVLLRKIYICAVVKILSKELISPHCIVAYLGSLRLNVLE